MSGTVPTMPPKPLRNGAVEVADETMDSLTGRGDPQQRFRIYRLCACEACGGAGRMPHPRSSRRYGKRCDDCRGEGRILDLVATSGDEGGVGVAIISLAREGELSECPVGVLEDGGSWLVSPWLPSPRNVSDAGRTLAEKRWTKGENDENR